MNHYVGPHFRQTAWVYLGKQTAWVYLILYLFLCVSLLKLYYFLHRIQIVSSFLANMEKASVFTKLTWRVSLRSQISEMINTRVKKSVS